MYNVIIYIIVIILINIYAKNNEKNIKNDNDDNKKGTSTMNNDRNLLELFRYDKSKRIIDTYDLIDIESKQIDNKLNLEEFKVLAKKEYIANNDYNIELLFKKIDTDLSDAIDIIELQRHAIIKYISNTVVLFLIILFTTIVAPIVYKTILLILPIVIGLFLLPLNLGLSLAAPIGYFIGVMIAIIVSVPVIVVIGIALLPTVPVMILFMISLIVLSPIIILKAITYDIPVTCYENSDYIAVIIYDVMVYVCEIVIGEVDYSTYIFTAISSIIYLVIIQPKSIITSLLSAFLTLICMYIIMDYTTTHII